MDSPHVLKVADLLAVHGLARHGVHARRNEAVCVPIPVYVKALKHRIDWTEEEEEEEKERCSVS